MPTKKTAAQVASPAEVRRRLKKTQAVLKKNQAVLKKIRQLLRAAERLVDSISTVPPTTGF